MWTPNLVRHVEGSENKIASALNYWIDSILGVTEFMIDTSISYSEVERPFFKGPRGKYPKSLKTWIKILLCEKQLIPLN